MATYYPIMNNNNSTNKNFNGVIAYNSNININKNTWTPIQFQDIEIEKESTIDATKTYFKASVKGIYNVGAVAVVTEVVDGNRYIVGLRKDTDADISYILGRGISGGTNLAGVGGSIRVVLEKDQEICAVVWVENNTSLFNTNGYNSFSAYLLEQLD